MSKELNTKDRLIIIGLTFTLFFGIFFLGKGITGLYLIDFEQDYCDENADCKQGEVCCNFYGEDSGICDKSSNCQAIRQITKEEKEKISSGLLLEEEYKFTEADKQMVSKMISSHIEKPQTTKSNTYSIITGGILLILGLVWIIYLKKK